jgi:hypothetical protein
LLAFGLAAALSLPGVARGQQIHRNGFEGRLPAWIKGGADATFQEIAHETTDLTARTGQKCEYIHVTAQRGNYIYYFYPTNRAPLNEDLIARVWIKSNRPGAQLLGRMVLPHERNPKNLDENLTVLLRGDQYQLVGRWQPLEIRQPLKAAKEQQQLMRFEQQRDFDISDSYLDTLILNVYGGPGNTEIWIDDLEVGPVLEGKRVEPDAKPTSPPVSKPAPRLASRSNVVEVNQDHLLVSGKRFFLRGIRSEMPTEALKALRDAGFNTIWLDAACPPDKLEQAANLGFWLVPVLPVTSPEGPSSPEVLAKDVNRFLLNDAVLFWDLGGGLKKEDKETVTRAIRVIRTNDSQAPVGADAWDGLQEYSFSLDLVGAHRWPLMTTLELGQFREWLDQRRRLARPGAFMWTWVQTHLPDWFTEMVYQRPGAAGFNEPIGPQPEQIRLLTYIALAAGYRGIGFWSDRFLADTHQGRDRLLALALLNQELQMLEPFLVTVKEDPLWTDTSIPEVKAAVFRTERGTLVLPIWLGKGSQFVPGQSAAAKLTIVVPEAPLGTTPWQITPVEIRSLHQERVVGGTRITVPEFGLTSAILFTADTSPTGILVHYQDQTRYLRETAARWARDLAQVELEKVTQVQEQLESLGHPLPDGEKLLQDARGRFQVCLRFWDNRDYRRAYQEANRVLRPLRILMRAQWERAIQGLDTPVASPYAVSFYTLPRHWRFMEQIRQATFGSNVLPNGDFELGPEEVPHFWSPQETTLDDVILESRRVPHPDLPPGSRESGWGGRRCLMLRIAPKNPELAPKALERTFLAINTPAVHLPPGMLVQITGWIRIPAAITATADGALFFDNAGGEPLGVRLVGPTLWRKFTLYRQVPANGLLSVTLGLTGIGTVYFDDIRIEPEVAASTAVQTAGR